MTSPTAMKIAIGPVLFEWGKAGLRDFYRRMAYETAADILYVGEVVCSKRAGLNLDELIALADELKPSGKTVVFSTLGLVMDEAEQQTLRRIVELAAQHGYGVEMNDMAGISVGEACHPWMVAGPHINTYNPETFDFLASVGVKRVVFPVELSQEMISGILTQRTARDVETEIFAFGRLPLTFSARCYTARAFQLPKAHCQYKCGDFPDGLAMNTQAGEPFLTINGIQTMSDRRFNLIRNVPMLAGMGVDIVRLSPQSTAMVPVVATWRACLDGRINPDEAMAELQRLHDGETFCNGYFHGRAGLDLVLPEDVDFGEG
jgi:collagenase-like PrtC family protease